MTHIHVCVIGLNHPGTLQLTPYIFSGTVTQVHLVGLDAFTARKYEDIFPAAHKVEVPIIQKSEYQVKILLTKIT